MKSVRLNKDIVISITDSILDEFYSNALKDSGCVSLSSLQEKIDGLHTQIFKQLWEDTYPILSKSLAALPSRVNTENRPFTLCVEEQQDLLSTVFVGRPSNKGADLMVTKQRWLIILKEPLKLQILLAQVREEGKTLRGEVKGILHSVNTTKQLLEVWPSIEKHIPAYVADPEKGITLPALTVSRLEEKINGIYAN